MPEKTVTDLSYGITFLLVFILAALFLVSVSYADLGSSANYRVAVAVNTYSEYGNSTSFEVVVGSSLSGDRANSSSYELDLGIIPATALFVGEDVSFTIYIPANNATGRDTSAFTSTDTIIFNITDVNGKKINATAAGGQGGKQDATVSIFRYENTGTFPLNVSLNFTEGVPSQVTVKAGWTDASYQTSCSSSNLTAAGSCANISVGGASQTPVLVANMTVIGAVRDVWLWADYNVYTAGSDLGSTLTHKSRKST